MLISLSPIITNNDENSALLPHLLPTFLQYMTIVTIPNKSFLLYIAVNP